MPEILSLAECCTVVSGSTPQTSVPEYWGGNIPWITPKDLSTFQGKYISTTAQQITHAGYDSCSTSLLPAGTVLLSSRAPIGYTAITACPMCTNQGFKSLIPNPQLIIPDYLFWWVKCNRSYLQTFGNGATFKEISKSAFDRIMIPLPPLEEQRRIADILDKAEELRKKRQKTIELLEELQTAIFLDMFGDPVTNPKGWPVYSVEQIAETKLGKMLDINRQSALPQKSYLRNANVRWGYFDLEDISTMGIAEAEQERYVVRPGDLLICEGGEPGRAAVWYDPTREIYYQKALHRVRVNPSQCTSEYLMHIFWQLSVSGALSDSISSVTIAHLTGEKLKKLRVPIPDLGVQREFVAKLAAINMMRTTYTKSIDRTNELISAIQQDVFK